MLSYRRIRILCVLVLGFSTICFFTYMYIFHTALGKVYREPGEIHPPVQIIYDTSGFENGYGYLPQSKRRGVILPPSSRYGSCSKDKGVHSPIFKQDQYMYFSETFVIDKDPAASWFQNEKISAFCDDKVTIFDNRFSVLNDVVLNPMRINNLHLMAKGGEEVRHVLHQSLSKEDYTFRSGFIELNCTKHYTIGPNVSYKWTKIIKLNKVLTGNTTLNATEWQRNFQYEPRFTIGVVRQDYANLHNWARAVYNCLLLMMYFKVQPNDVVIVFLDGHPFTNLDKTWEDIFGRVIRVGRLDKPVLFRQFALGLDESDGLISKYESKTSAYLEECRSVILQQHNLSQISKKSCDTPTFTLLIRRNAVFHPRNVEGKVGRKIYNEAELLGGLMKAFPNACVQSVLMESLPMASQLEIISQTDILIGMHGAGMTHSLFLPQHASILELFAKDFKRERPWFRCYESIARWRGLKYDSWENVDNASEMPYDFTIVPVEVIISKAKTLLKQMCQAK